MSDSKFEMFWMVALLAFIFSLTVRLIWVRLSPLPIVVESFVNMRQYLPDGGTYFELDSR